MPSFFPHCPQRFIHKDLPSLLNTLLLYRPLWLR